MNRLQAIKNEMMAIMRERSIDAGYKSIRVGRSSLRQPLVNVGAKPDECDEAITALIDDGYLQVNGQYTVDIGDKDYFKDHEYSSDDVLILCDGEKPVEQKKLEPKRPVDPVIKGPSTYSVPKPAESVSKNIDNEALESALADLEIKCQPIPDKETKLRVLNQLARYMHPSIGAVLDDIASFVEA